MCAGVYVCLCETFVFAWSRGRSVRGPREQLSLRGEQLLVQRRKEGVNSERVTLTEPTQLLHVQTAQRAQNRHPLVQLQGRHTHTHKFNTPIGWLNRQHPLYSETRTLCRRLSWLSRCKMCLRPNSMPLCTL